VTNACYVYAIVGRDTPLPAAGPDAGFTELAKVPCWGLAAVIESIAEDAAPLTVEAVLHHEAVVEAVRRQGPALPVRFGTVFHDETAVTAALAEQYEVLSADLQRLGAKVEVSLTAIWATPLSDQPDPTWRIEETTTRRGAGAQYLLERAAVLRRDDALNERARNVASDIDRSLGWLALERRVSLLPAPRIAVRAAYLLDAERVSAFRAAFESIRGTRRELRILLSGPWPPYSFVKRTQAKDAAAEWLRRD
jgi:hypothetical protein